MKRPPGVPQSPRQGSPREPERTAGATAAATESAAPTKGAAGRKQPRSSEQQRSPRPSRPSRPARSEPEATTEPLTVVPATPDPDGDTAVVPPLPSDTRPTPGPAPDAGQGLLARLTGRGAATAGASRKVKPAATVLPAADRPLTARAARQRLRAARRARKQYERNEVRRFTSRSRRRRNLWIGAIGTVAALVAFVVVGVYSPLMALRTIEVTGTERIPAADIAQALEGQLGTPLPLIDLADVKRELSEFSLIRSYVTESRPPDTLVVRIVERHPVGTITTPDSFDLVDAAGVVIAKSPARPEGYPMIEAAGGASGAGFQAAVSVVNALPEGILGQLDSVTAATKDDVTLTLVGGARVVWGNSERSEYKAVVLSALLVSHPVGSVTEYDVSAPDSAVVR